jgi:hypothetical protein
MAMAVLMALAPAVWSMAAEAQGAVSELQRFDARLDADAAVLSPGEQGRLARAADRLSTLPNRREAAERIGRLDQEMSFAWTELPGPTTPLAGPWPVTPTLTLPDLYAPTGSASTPSVWTPHGGSWPEISH